MHHIGAQLLAHARRQGQHDRFVGSVEIVDVTPVAQFAQRCVVSIEKDIEQLMLADTRGTEQENIVAIVMHVEAKTQGLHRPLLTEVIIEGL